MKWAQDQEVHIMSMSWTIKEKDGNRTGADNLKTAIEEAAKRGIILFCASDDIGMFKDARALPASSDTKMIKKVGSCNENGDVSGFVNKNNVDYLLPGEKLDGVKDWKSEDKGSSASTALASGLAALFLYCLERHGYNKEDLANSRMIALFDKLKISPTEGALVDVTELLNEASAAHDPVRILADRIREKVTDELRRDGRGT